MNEPSAFYSQMARDTVSVLRPFHASVAPWGRRRIFAFYTWACLGFLNMPVQSRYVRCQLVKLPEGNIGPILQFKVKDEKDAWH